MSLTKIHFPIQLSEFFCDQLTINCFNKKLIVLGRQYKCLLKNTLILLCWFRGPQPPKREDKTIPLIAAIAPDDADPQ